MCGFVDRTSRGITSRGMGRIPDGFVAVCCLSV